MNNQYLGALGLMPGASKSEIKTAYRQLSKVYHPDVSKDDNAREKFIEINEAYKFLTAVGPRPATIESNAPAYDYNAQDHHYDEWRRKARAFARRKAEDAARRQIELIKILLKGMNVFVGMMFIFNVLMTVDYYRPKKINEAYQFLERDIFYKRAHKYTDVIFPNQTFRLKPGGIIPASHIKRLTIHSTSILNIPIALDVMDEDSVETYTPLYSLYNIFGYLIPALLIFAFLYKFIFRTLENQLTIGIFMVFIGLFQLYMLLKF